MRAIGKSAVIAIPKGHKGAQRRSNLITLVKFVKDCFAAIAMTVFAGRTGHHLARVLFSTLACGGISVRSISAKGIYPDFN
jgi:hypothetical protein